MLLGDRSSSSPVTPRSSESWSKIRSPVTILAPVSLSALSSLLKVSSPLFACSFVFPGASNCVLVLFVLCVGLALIFSDSAPKLIHLSETGVTSVRPPAGACSRSHPSAPPARPSASGMLRGAARLPPCGSCCGSPVCTLPDHRPAGSEQPR